MYLDVLDAETEGMIGYMIEQELYNQIKQPRQSRGVVTILSQIIIDPTDVAFENPTKFIGPIYTKEQLIDVKDKEKIFKKDGKCYRQVVPSPQPIKLIDEQMIALKLLVDNNCIVICAGGGGIPIIETFDQNKRCIKGIEAVIDKDKAASMVGKSLHANGLLIFTDVNGVAIGYNKNKKQWIKSASPDVMQEFLQRGEFPSGSMGPKVESCIDFLLDDSGKKWAMIASLEDADRVISHEAGTLITNEHGSGHLEFY